MKWVLSHIPNEEAIAKHNFALAEPLARFISLILVKLNTAEMNPLVVFRLLVLLFATPYTEGYKPVVIVHGLFDGPKQFENLKHFITKVRLEIKMSTCRLCLLNFHCDF